jgi:hypothetical protein
MSDNANPRAKNLREYLYGQSRDQADKQILDSAGTHSGVKGSSALDSPNVRIGMIPFVAGGGLPGKTLSPQGLGEAAQTYRPQPNQLPARPPVAPPRPLGTPVDVLAGRGFNTDPFQPPAAPKPAAPPPSILSDRGFMVTSPKDEVISTQFKNWLQYIYSPKEAQ